jgi:hypothetical protein
MNGLVDDESAAGCASGQKTVKNIPRLFLALVWN